MGWKFQGPDRPPAAFEPTPPPEGEAVPASVDAGDTSYRTGQWRWGTQFQPAAEPTVMDIVKRGAKEALGQGWGLGQRPVLSALTADMLQRQRCL